MKILPASLFLALAGCPTPAREAPAGSTAPNPSPSAASLQDSGSPAPAAVPSPAASVPGPKRASSAYPGCGRPLPQDQLWDETSEEEVRSAIDEAKACAGQHGRRVLLEFVAPWCDDCQEMTKLDETPSVAQALQRRFERVRINVGKWDRHEALRDSFGVRALATYVVLDPKTSKQLAKTTLEPITKPGQKLTAEDWRAWLERH